MILMRMIMVDDVNNKFSPEEKDYQLSLTWNESRNCCKDGVFKYILNDETVDLTWSIDARAWLDDGYLEAEDAGVGGWREGGGGGQRGEAGVCWHCK